MCVICLYPDVANMDSKVLCYSVLSVQSVDLPLENLFEKRPLVECDTPAPAVSPEDDDCAGYADELFVDCPDDDFRCPVCLEVPKNPLQTPCGHLLCKRCLERLPKKNGIFECPEDRQKQNVFPDQMTKKKILQLKVKCIETGCKKKIELQNLKEHLKECRYGKEICPQKCGEMIQRTDMKHHVKNICANRIITCHFCQKEMTYYHYKEAHKEKYCDKLTVKCPLCSQEMLRERLKIHCGKGIKGDCPKVEIQCKFSYIGCPVKCLREAMGQHLHKDLPRHMHLLAKDLKVLNEKAVSLEAHIQTELDPEVTFLWAIENWSKCLNEENPRVILSRIFHFKNQEFRLRIDLRRDARGNMYLVLSNILTKPLQPGPFFVTPCFYFKEPLTRIQMEVKTEEKVFACYSVFVDHPRFLEPQGKEKGPFTCVLPEYPTKNDALLLKIRCTDYRLSNGLSN